MFALLIGGWVYGMGVAFRRWRVPVRAAAGVGIVFGALLMAAWLFRLAMWMAHGGLPPELGAIPQSSACF
jgi:hypothetical protein